MKSLAPLAALLLAAGLTACVSMKSYPDPAFQVVQVKDFKPVAAPQPVQVVAEFKRDGELRPEASARLKARVERALAQTGVLRPDDSSGTRLKVTANNLPDRGDSLGVSIKAGLSMGLSGGEVVDHYDFDFVLTRPGGQPGKDVFLRHALKSLVGSADAPLGAKPEDPARAFDRLVQDVVFAYVKRYQDDAAIQAGLQ